MREDEVGLSAWLTLHHLGRRGQRGQGHGSKGVHDQVYPQYLRNGERQFGAYGRTSQHQQQGRHVNHKLEIKEPLYVLIQRATPHHGLDNAVKRVVDEGYVAGVLGYAGARP